MPDFYDFHIHSSFSEGKSSIEQMADRAKILGFNGICFSEFYKNSKQLDNLKSKIKNINEKTNFEIFLGLEARTHGELKKLKNMRKEYDVLIVKGGNLDLNRKAVETPEVDILTHPELNRIDSGLNHVMAKLATKNNVAIEVNFREILLSHKNTRSLIMKNIQNNVKLCKRYHTSIILSSGAASYLQLKDPKIIMSMGCLFGLELKESKNSLSCTPKSIIDMIKRRQSKNWIRLGVEVIK